MTHLKSPIAFAWVVALVCLLPQGALAQANPRIGTWKLNVAKSTYQQGKAPSSETRTYLATDDGGRFHYRHHARAGAQPGEQAFI